MFGRSNWAIVGLAQESLEAFRTNLEDRAIMASLSQMAASAVTRQFESDTLGINPFSAPRLDEQCDVAIEHQEALALYVTSEPETRANLELPAEILECEAYGSQVEQFQLHPTMPVWTLGRLQ